MRHGEQANAARLGLVVVTAFLLFSVQLTSAHASPPTARVVAVDYPERVFPGMRFNATILVEYSDRFLADVGIWDARAGTIVQSLTLISSFTGPGQAKFSLQLTAPKNETDWHLIAMTRVWWQDAWYEDPDGGMKLFTVKVSDNIVLTVNSTGADSTVRFDGSTYIVNEGSPVAIVLKPGPHTLNVTPIIQARTGERFVFVGWSDGVRSSSRQIVLVSDAQILATYRTEYYLTVQSDAAAVSGQGWYVQGFEAPVAAVPDYSTTSWFGLLVHRYQFSQWSGDSSSGSPVARILMDGPKVVKAQWKLAQTTPGRDLLPYGFLAASLPLAIRILYVYSKRKSGPLSSMHTPIRRWGRISFLMMIVLFASFPVAPAEAQLPAQPGASIMKIGDADWYYWSQPASDTCLLWLGGGISQQTVIGYNYYWINPFDYESFGTIRFVQDLAKYYCVIALQRGSYESYNPAANRTIHQELYQIQSTIIMQVHQWIKQQGYQHTFLVGYSVGGQAAAMEVTLRAPNSWLSPDGVILITVPLERSLIDHAHSVRASVLFLYGGNLPDFVATGREYYDNIPAEGWYGSYYYHKEFHVLEEAGHEVWTIRENGTYNPQALNLVVNFIEKSKALQLTPETDSIEKTASGSKIIGGNERLNLTSVLAPDRVAPGEVFSLLATVSYDLLSNQTVRLVAYDINTHQVSSSTELFLDGAGQKVVRLLAPANYNVSGSSAAYQGNVSLAVILLQKDGDQWLPVAGPYFIKTMVANSVTLKVETSFPNIPFELDLAQYTSQASGRTQFEIKGGVHVIQVQPVIYLNGTTRLVFSSWDDSTTNTARQLTLSNDTTIWAIYRRQYLVNASSPYGKVTGPGWYDENSTATIFAQPPILDQPSEVFVHWEDDASYAQPRIVLLADSPKAFTAVWKSWDDSSRSQQPSPRAFAFSLILFLALLAWNLQLGGKRMRLESDRTEE